MAINREEPRQGIMQWDEKRIEGLPLKRHFRAVKSFIKATEPGFTVEDPFLDDVKQLSKELLLRVTTACMLVRTLLFCYYSLGMLL